MKEPANRVVKIGDIVTIVSDRSLYNGEQGEVVEINDEDGDEDGPVGIKFDPQQIKFNAFKHAECIVRHEDDELRVDNGWACTTLATRLYPGYYHTTYTFKHPFDPSLPCMCEGCSENASRRCVINEWGNVSEIDLCEPHAAEAHGKLFEQYHWKRDYPFPLAKQAA